MDARSIATAIASLLLLVNTAIAQTAFIPAPAAGRQIGAAATVQSQNFIVSASSRDMAEQVAQAAESYRSELSQHWLGRKLPNWNVKCPIVVMAADNLGAGGETTFTLSNRNIVHWHMRVQGTYTRILDSVLPHEITHTILATHFAQWANMCHVGLMKVHPQLLSTWTSDPRMTAC